MLHHFRQGKICSFRIEVALDNLKVRRSRSEEVVGFFVREVPETEDLANLARRE